MFFGGDINQVYSTHGILWLEMGTDWFVAVRKGGNTDTVAPLPLPLLAQSTTHQAQRASFLPLLK